MKALQWLIRGNFAIRSGDWKREMITIHIDPAEIHPHEGGSVEEQAPDARKGLARAILGIVLILAVIIIFLMTACSGSAAPAVF
jgi:hypothetical protein